MMSRTLSKGEVSRNPFSFLEVMLQGLRALWQTGWRVLRAHRHNRKAGSGLPVALGLLGRRIVGTGSRGRGVWRWEHGGSAVGNTGRRGGECWEHGETRLGGSRKAG